MSVSFEDFLTSFPMQRERPYSATELEQWKARVPEPVRALLQQTGLASSKRFFFTLAPSEGAPLLEAWGVNPDKAQAFMTSAFGLIVFATSTEVGVIDPFSGSASLWEPALAVDMLDMDMVHDYPEFESRKLGAKPVARTEVFAMHPPVKLGGHFGNGCGSESNVTFAREDRATHVAYQASLYGNRAKGLPKALALAPSAKKRDVKQAPSGTTQAKAKAKVAPAKPSPFRDPALHYAVVSALADAKKIRAEELHAALAKLANQSPDDEDAHLAKAVKALRAVALSRPTLASVRRIKRSLAFERVFESIVGVETGGEADYMDLRSLAGIGALKALEELDLSDLQSLHARPLDLAPLAKHPALKKLHLGAGKTKGLQVLTQLPALKKLVVPKDFADPVLEKLRAKKVTIARVG